jgi:membrane protein
VTTEGSKAPNAARLPSGLSLLVAAWRRYVEQAMTVYAAAVSFWAMVGLVPLIAMVVFAVAIFASPDAVEAFFDELVVTVPGETVEVLVEQARRWVSTSREISTVGLVIAVIVASWGASLGMTHLIRAINVVHGLKPRNFVHRRVAALGHIVAALAFAVPIVILVAATPAAMAAAETPTATRWVVGFIRWPLVVGLFAVVVAALYWSAPSQRPRFRLWSPGAAVALVVFLVGSGLFSLYVANVEHYDSSYGSLGAVVVTLLWIYVTASAILFGAEVDALRVE